MLSRSAAQITPLCTQVRGMATLKDISIRLKAVTNIQKITKSMKMVSAAKFARAERELKSARPYGKGTQAFYEKAEIQQDESKPNHLMVAITSDRGLCGGTHSSIVKAIRAKAAAFPQGTEFKIIPVGDKSRTMLQRQYGNNILFHFSDIGKRPPTFLDASEVANSILNCGFAFDFGEMYYNRFRSVVAYTTLTAPIFTSDKVAAGEKFALYDSVDEDVLQCYNEFALASLVCFAQKEGASTEQSQRMTAMDSASKNAGEMIDKLTLTYNRTRQAVITRELIEIISGAAALK